MRFTKNYWTEKFDVELISRSTYYKIQALVKSDSLENSNIIDSYEVKKVINDVKTQDFGKAPSNAEIAEFIHAGIERIRSGLRIRIRVNSNNRSVEYGSL